MGQKAARAEDGGLRCEEIAHRLSDALKDVGIRLPAPHHSTSTATKRITGPSATNEEGGDQQKKSHEPLVTGDATSDDSSLLSAVVEDPGPSLQLLPRIDHELQLQQGPKAAWSTMTCAGWKNVPNILSLTSWLVKASKRGDNDDDVVRGTTCGRGSNDDASNAITAHLEILFYFVT